MLRLLKKREVIENRDEILKLEKKLKEDEKRRVEELNKLPEWERRGFANETEYREYYTWHGPGSYMMFHDKKDKQKTGDKKI